MAKAFATILMELHIKENGCVSSLMDKVEKPFQTSLTMSAALSMVRNLALVSSLVLMEPHLKANSLTITSMVMVYIFGPMEFNMKACGSTIRSMVRASSSGWTALASTMETSRRTRDTVMECINGSLARGLTEGSGVMV